MLVLSFVISWGPITVVDLIQSYLHPPEQDVRVWIRPITECLCYSSSILNPVFMCLETNHLGRKPFPSYCVIGNSSAFVKNKVQVGPFYFILYQNVE